MKKATLMLGMVCMLAIVSCKKETTTTETVSPNDTVVVEKEVISTPTADTVSIKTEESDGTSVSVNGDGIDVKSKDGSKKTTVEVKEGGGSVEVKK